MRPFDYWETQRLRLRDHILARLVSRTGSTDPKEDLARANYAAELAYPRPPS